MRKMAIAALAAVSVIAVAAPASAAVVINPATGASGSFSWDGGLGSIDEIDGAAESTFSVLAGAGDKISVTLNDCCVVGDEFELILNGFAVTPTSVTTPGGLFSYTFTDVALAGGVNIFGINLTALAPGFTSGGASYSFSALTAGGIPEPTTWAMMILGLGGVGASMRRRKQAVRVNYSMA